MSDHPEDRHETNPVLAKARDLKGDSEITVLSTGVRVKLQPVSPSLIAEIQMQVKYPDVPRVIMEDGRELENPAHPNYIRDCEEVDAKRVTRVLEAITMFAFELVDGIPDNGWDHKLKVLDRMGTITLGDIDFDNPIDREFAYKKYVAVGNADIQLAGGMAGIRGEDVAAASEMFRGK